MREILDKIGFIPFQPVPFFQTGHAQTLLSHLFSYMPVMGHNQKYSIKLPDNDEIILVENFAQQPKEKAPNASNRIMLLVHGLTGTQNSAYMQRPTCYLTEAGFPVFRMNLRGCGEGFYLAQKLYHSGMSEDVHEAISWLGKQYPTSPVTLIGFSLGANLVLKLAGELGKNIYSAPNLDSVIAVSPPLNLETSVRLLLHKKNKIFNDYFVKRLIKYIQIKSKFIPNLPTKLERKIKTVFDFDEQVTAPHSGFKNAKDYYKQASSGQYVHDIKIPTLILHAIDDPFIGNAEFYQFPDNENIDLLVTQTGGHVSWLGKTDSPLYYRWMDRVILKWIMWLDGKHRAGIS